MTDQLPTTVAAGWYQDPDDSTQVRWWNGLAWTDHRAPLPADPAE
jgi:hypothetical protein